MTIREARIMFRSIRKLAAAKAELERLEADQVWRSWGLGKVVNNIEEILSASAAHRMGRAHNQKETGARNQEETGWETSKRQWHSLIPLSPWRRIAQASWNPF
jgi:hypothetical protein